VSTEFQSNNVSNTTITAVQQQDSPIADNSAALIGGIVGGLFGLACLVGAIVGCVIHRRRTDDNNQDKVTEHSAINAQRPTRHNIYETVPPIIPTDYQPIKLPMYGSPVHYEPLPQAHDTYESGRIEQL
jgi:hypothetical protein